jgi:hypothetical protein
MMPRVTIAHTDETFREGLATALRQMGCEVISVTDSAFVTDLTHPSDRLEMVITQFTGTYAGVRIRLTGWAPGTDCAGPLRWVFTEHATVADIVSALRRFASPIRGSQRGGVPGLSAVTDPPVILPPGASATPRSPRTTPADAP